VTANSSVTLEGVATATVMLDPARLPPARQIAALVAHEAFHVFQRRAHPSWSPNEATLFTYPVERVDNVAWRRVETDALRRAVAARSEREAACAAAMALGARRRRFATIDSASAAYERGTELNEGLAWYIQLVVGGRPVDLPAEDWAPEDVRLRGYTVGAAMAMVLDRLAPGWKDSLDRADGRSIDALLGDAVTARRAAGCPTTAELEARLAAARPAADSAVRSLERRRSEARDAVLAAGGWTLVVRSTGAPLFAKSFDPWNVRRLSAVEVLHGRMVQLGHTSGEIEVLGRASLTEAAGAHPLFSGVRTLTIAGLPEAPSMSDSSGTTIVRAAGVEGRFTGARVDHADQARRVTLIVP
jgi:hypothetical protein